MLLSRNRIWGNMMGSGYRTGYKDLKMNFPAMPMSLNYEQARLEMMFPFVKDWGRLERKKMKYEAKKSRIFMRGIKIGRKMEGGGRRGMGIFETRREKDAKKAE